jgi:hypothetical protein
MSETASSNSASIPYATPSQASRPRTAPAVWIALIGVALIGLGGCFCIGIMAALIPSLIFGAPAPAPALTSGLIEFLVVLHVAAFGCFGGAVFLIQKGVRLLLALTK